MFFSAMEARAGQPDVKRRRLRAKTTVGHAAVALLAVAQATQGTGQVSWAKRFSDEEDLPREEEVARKAVYLVTLRHPSHAAQSTRGLRAPRTLTREQGVAMISYVIANP